MPHSQHGKGSTTKQRHRRSGSHVSKSNKEQPKQVPNNAHESQRETDNATPSAKPGPEQQRPWSRWIPGDDGRWFYQGRLKADGSGWEYQFTGGYPPARRRRDPGLVTACAAPSQTLPYTPPNGATDVVDAPESRQPHIDAVDHHADDENDDDLVEEGEDTRLLALAPATPINVTLPEQSKMLNPANDARPSAATRTGNGSGNDRQAVVKHTGGKAGTKLKAIVKADKGRRISSRKRIKSWLSEVTP